MDCLNRHGGVTAPINFCYTLNLSLRCLVYQLILYKGKVEQSGLRADLACFLEMVWIEAESRPEFRSGFFVYNGPHTVSWMI